MEDETKEEEKSQSKHFAFKEFIQILPSNSSSSSSSTSDSSFMEM